MTTWILAVLGLWVVQTMIPSTLRYTGDAEKRAENLQIALRGRDNPPPMPVMGGRAERALANLQEALPVFLTVGLLLEIHGDVPALATQGAAFFFVMRVLYVPAYLSAILGLRSMVWMSSWLGLAAMVWALVG